MSSIPRQLRDIDAQLVAAQADEDLLWEHIADLLAEAAAIVQTRDALLELRHLAATRRGPTAP